MARRPQLDDAFRSWLHRLGVRIRDLRHAKGWTQTQAAERCTLDYKHFQAIESGRTAATAHTLFVIAASFGVEPGDLMPSAQVAVPAVDTRWAPLRMAGWQVAAADDDQPQKGTVPVYDLAAAAGPAGEASDTPTVIAWAAPSSSKRRTAGLFLAQARGTSMEPLIPDGAWCIFRQTVAPPLLGRVVLVRTDDTSIGDVGVFQVKRIGALELDDGGIRVRLDSANRDQPATEIRAAGEAEVQLLGEFIEVVKPRRRR